MNDETQTNPFPPDKLFVPPPGHNDLSGKMIGNYQLVRKIAQGGMGIIYEAIQINLDRKVALKILTAELAERPEFLQRFEREAKSAAALNHPNIVAVHDFGQADGRQYIVMEFIEGENLSEYISKRGKIPVENALAVIEQAALALQAAAEKSIIHRDIKPSNLMVTRDGRVKVADMGLAKILSQDSELTMSSVSIGSPHFIAPEQAGDSKNADHRVDIYSLGVTLLFLVTGKHAYDGDSPISVVLAHATKPLPTGAELGTELPAEIEALIRRMAAKNPGERYQTYDALLNDLQLIKQGFMPSAAPVPPGSKAFTLPETKVDKKYVAAIALGVVLLLALIGNVVFSVFKTHRQEMAALNPKPSPAAPANFPANSVTPSENKMSPPPQQQQALSQLSQPPQDHFQPFQPQDNFQSPDPSGNFEGPPGQQDSANGNQLRPRLPMPMGMPPQQPNLENVSTESAAALLAAADDYAAKNPSEFMNILARYRIAMRKAAGTDEGRIIQNKLQQWAGAQAQAATKAIHQFEMASRNALSSGGAQAAYDVWKTFPTNLRSRETDQQILQFLQQILPDNFQPLRPQQPQP